MKFVEDITAELRKAGVLDKSGTAFMSHVSTLTKGKYLVVGLNPGGESEGCLTIGQSLENFRMDDYSPFDEKWDNGKYQLGIRALFKCLDVDLKAVCATNFIYERSRTEKELPTKSVNAYRNILSMVVSHIEPEVIIILSKKVFLEIRHLVNADAPRRYESDHKGYYIYRSDGVLNDRKVKLLCLPHLSRYAIYTRQKQLNFIKNEIVC